MRIETHGLGRVSYQAALAEQTRFSEKVPSTDVQLIWFEAEPVITLGLRGEAPVSADEIEVLRVNRGGAATYHGPGQLMIFPCCRLPELGLSVREWVCVLLKTTQATLREHGIVAEWDLARPGLFTSAGKIASIGLKIRNGWTLHGLALNVNGDLQPFSAIEACGMKNAKIDQMSQWLGPGIESAAVFQTWARCFTSVIG